MKFSHLHDRSGAGSSEFCVSVHDSWGFVIEMKCIWLGF